MSSLALISSAGRLGRGSFIIGVLIVYVLSFLSQVLLAGPVIARAGPWSFVVVQGLLIWTWFILHARRLCDAGHGKGMAIGIAIVYALAIVLLVLIVMASTPEAATTPASAAPASKDSSNLFGFFIVIYLLALLTGDPSLGIFAYILTAIAVLLLLPILIAFGFTIWTATRRTATARP